MGTKVNGNKVRIKSLLLMVFRVQQPYKVRTFTTFLASPPWCSRYAVHNKVAFKTEVCNVFSSKKLFFFFFLLPVYIQSHNCIPEELRPQ